MRKYIHLILILVTAVALAIPLNALALEVLVRNATFYAPENGPYVETNLLIVGNSLGYAQKDNGKFQGNVEVTLMFKDTSGIVAFDKYTLTSVEIEDTANIGVGIIDKQRFLLPNGTYMLEAVFTDLLTGESITVTEPVHMDFAYDEIQISDIDLVDTYSKSEAGDADPLYVRSGLYMTPYVINFYPDNVDRLTFYFEVYNTQLITDHSHLLVTYSIKKTGKEGVPYGHYNYKKAKVQEVNAFFGEFNIDNLPSGNYDLVVEVRDKSNHLLSMKKMFFQRSKFLVSYAPDNVDQVNSSGTFVESFTMEELKYQLRSMQPVSSVAEAKTINQLIKSEDLEAMRKFFLNYWVTRNDVNPSGEWAAYAELVKKVNAEFSTNTNEGFETDRGRVYLEYGAPNQLLDMPREPGAYPYQIWQYYTTEKANNAKFVFYNNDLVTNNYELIHSTAPYEIYNNDWQKLIYGTFTGGNTPTDNGSYSPDHFGGRADERFGE